MGCGEGALARKLRDSGCQVTAIDRDEGSIRIAREDGVGIDFVLGDFTAHPFEPASFDFVVSIAALPHMAVAAALRRMRGLLRPGLDAPALKGLLVGTAGSLVTVPLGPPPIVVSGGLRSILIVAER